MQFHYLSITGDESVPKACKLQHVCVIRGQYKTLLKMCVHVHTCMCIRAGERMKEEGKEAQSPLSLHSYLYLRCASLR